MSENKKSSANKFALIYQFNSESPLFARVAADELENDNINKALEILENGIKINPTYPTAYFIYAKALAIAGNIDEAKNMIKSGNELLNSKETEEYYNTLVDELFQKSTPIRESKRITFVDENLLTDQFENGKLESDKIEDLPKEQTFEDRLDDLASELSSAKINVNFDKPEEQTDPESIVPDIPLSDDEITPNMVSETLAGIFFVQGNYKQARKIYKQLVLKEPGKMNLFAQKIAEIDALILENKGD